MAAQPKDQPDAASMARLLLLVDGSLLPDVRAGRTALADSGLALEPHVRTAMHHLTEAESDLACLLAAYGVLT